MVPFGKATFFPGRLIHTNEFLVLLGEGIMVGLPSGENTEKILRNLLAKEKVVNEVEFKELATMTEGYTGSDLKNLCTNATYRPVRELIHQERLKSLVIMDNNKNSMVVDSMQMTKC
ncbi:hypothetical protein GLYMA_19G101401v4 [Glycine max]|nr:hypothetical protein GLYMA_19G101401v4 [Glycine max]